MSSFPFLSCKFIYTDTNGLCITMDDIEDENKEGMFKIKKFDIYLDRMGYEIFKNSRHKYFKAVKNDKGFHQLTPIRKENSKDSDLPKMNSSVLSKGAYGQAIQFPFENVVQKKIVDCGREISSDFVKEIAVYRLFKEFTCLPHFYNFLFEKSFEDKSSIIPTTKQCDVSHFSFILEKGTATLDQSIYDYKDMKSVMFQISKCLKLFNSQGIMHLDLKPANIIITNEFLKNGSINLKAQIIDWGICEIDHCPQAYSNKQFNKQTLWWRSPEILFNEPYNFKADIFSLGIMFLEMNISLDGEYRYLFSDFENKRVETEKEYNKAIANMIIHPTPLLSKEVVYMTLFQHSLSKIIAMNLIRRFDLNTKIGKFKASNEMKLFTDTNIFPIFMENDLKLLDEMNALSDKVLSEMETEDANFLDLVSHMFEINPELRYSYDDIIIHPYFQNIKRQSYPLFPVFLNKMPEIDLSSIYGDENDERMEKRNFCFSKIITEYELSNEALFLAIQLFDLYNIEIKDKLAIKEFHYDLSLCCILANMIYPGKHKVHKTIIEDIWIDGIEDAYGFINFRIKQIIQALNGNLIFPSLYSYMVNRLEGKNPLPNKHILALYDIYTNSRCYLDFEIILNDSLNW